MDGWLLLVARLEEIKTRGIGGNQTNTTAIPSSTSCFLLASDAVLEVCQGGKVAPHSSQTSQNLKEEMRERRREMRRSRRRTASPQAHLLSHQIISSLALLSSVSFGAKI